MQHSLENLKTDFAKWQMPALAVGVAGAALTVLGYFTIADKGLFWEIYLAAFMMVIALSLGCLGFLMMSHLATGRWFHFIQRPLEAGAKTIWFALILFAGVWAGRSHLYEGWINRHDGAKPQAQVQIGFGTEHTHPIEIFNRAKHAYLTDTMWTARAGICFALWIGMAALLTRWSRKQQDTAGGEPWGIRQRRLSGPGIVIFALSSTVIAFDWLVALNADWYSSIYGAITFISFGITALAFLAVIMSKVRDYEPYKILMTNRQSHDIGTMMFAFTILWAYMQAGQLIIIWNGNLIEETIYYHKRIAGHWPAMDWLLFLFAFLVPFVLLLNQPLKRNKNILAVIGAFVFLMRYVDWYWEIVPWFRDVTFHWLLIAAPAGMLGLWFFLFLKYFVASPAPVKTDARFQRYFYDVIHHEDDLH